MTSFMPSTLEALAEIHAVERRLAGVVEELGAIGPDVESMSCLSEFGRKRIAKRTDALGQVALMVHDDIEQRLFERVEQVGRLLAKEVIVPAAREANGLTFITGNAYMPPLRSFGAAEEVWALGQHGTEGAWERLVETIEHELSVANVLMESPESDNSLYVIDLARFEFDESVESDHESDSWRPIANSGQ